MKITNETITKGFITAGLMNVSVLIFSRFFTNATIPEFDPAVMSNFGLLMILIWGLAYISVAKTYQHVKWLVAVFAVEKLIYGVVWVNWLLNNSLSDVFEKDLMAGMFYSIYGFNDWMFCGFFLLVFVKLNKGG
ncbi:MAG: hypothetical protein ACJA1A_003876 [Saprospiraceae bacterium]|jgi:hypothetical protein